MFQLFNYTDGVLASEHVFETEEEAKLEAERWHSNRRGMDYRTCVGTRIDPDQILLQVLPIEGD